MLDQMVGLFCCHPPIPRTPAAMVDPHFALLASPLPQVSFRDEKSGFHSHPHRGMSTVSYMTSGSFEHE
jgi:redox-sensitive bicupin YhaK (pirin superfamily)